MIKLALLVRLEAKPGKAAEVESFLRGALPLVGGAATVKPFTQKLGVNYPVVLADEKVQQAIGGIEAIPTTFIIDSPGRVVKKHSGFANKDEFEQEIKPLLNP